MKPELIIAIAISLLVGMLMAFGIVLVFTFYASNDDCRSALYAFLSFI